jgi:hypothetical protein
MSQIKMATTKTARSKKRKLEDNQGFIPKEATNFLTGAMTVGLVIRGTLGRPPMTLIFMEYRAVMVKIEAKRWRILSLVVKIPVIMPAIKPAAMAGNRDNHGFIPWVMQTADTAAPKGKLPSTVKSGKSRTRKVIKTPRVMRP